MTELHLLSLDVLLSSFFSLGLLVRYIVKHDAYKSRQNDIITITREHPLEDRRIESLERVCHKGGLVHTIACKKALRYLLQVLGDLRHLRSVAIQSPVLPPS